MTRNPLLPLLPAILRGLDAPISEHQLLKRLEVSIDWSPLPPEPNLALFRKHFLLMNALYQWQAILWREEELWLTVSPLRIGFEGGEAAQHQAVAAAEDSALREFYLDWSQFIDTDSAQVAQWLDGFWRRLRAPDKRRAALTVLELTEEDVDWSAITRQYRRLAARTHPDRGGDREQFLVVRAAYETLRSHRDD